MTPVLADTCLPEDPAPSWPIDAPHCPEGVPFVGCLTRAQVEALAVYRHDVEEWIYSVRAHCE